MLLTALTRSTCFVVVLCTWSRHAYVASIQEAVTDGFSFHHQRCFSSAMYSNYAAHKLHRTCAPRSLPKFGLATSLEHHNHNRCVTPAYDFLFVLLAASILLKMCRTTNTSKQMHYDLRHCVLRIGTPRPAPPLHDFFRIITAASLPLMIH